MHDSDRGWSPEAPPALSPSCRARGSQSHTFHPSTESQAQTLLRPRAKATLAYPQPSRLVQDT